MYKILAKTEFIGKRVIYLPTCHSTNTESAKMLKDGQLGNGDIVITDNQIKGKGQNNNVWISEPGENLTLSIIYIPENLLAIDQFSLTVIITNSILEFLSNYGVNSSIKWPNDIFVGNKKIAGILISNSIRGAFIADSIIGLGININQAKFPFNATSMSTITGKSYTLNDVLNNLVTSIDKHLSKKVKFELQWSSYQKNLFGRGVKYKFQDHLRKIDYEGKIIGINERGKLLVETQNEIYSYNHKEISILF